MKSIPQLTALLALALGLTAGTASATTFDYSYIFVDGGIVSGTLDGTQDGHFIDGVSNVSVFLNGTAMPGSVFTATYDQASASFLAGPVVSFDAALNNFFFANSDLAGGDFGADSLFYLTNAADFGGPTALASSPTLIASQDIPTMSGNWSLTEATTPAVPDGGATLALLGTALAALACVRRKLAVA